MPKPFHSLNTGKYDTYKGSTLSINRQNHVVNFIGKYDPYKGSTLVKIQCHIFSPFLAWGNMILIKDRHILNTHSVLLPPLGENMILIKDRHF